MARNFVISISGNGECGKDTAAPMFSRLLGIPYKESTSACVVDPWWDEIQAGKWSANRPEMPDDSRYDIKNIVIEPYQYASKAEFHEDRRNRRMDWVHYIEYFNWNYGNNGIGLYEKTVEDGNHILTGIRRTGQFERCLDHIIDVAIWINRDSASHDESQEYGEESCDYTIDNNGTLEDLVERCNQVAYNIMSNLEHGDFTTDWIIQKLDDEEENIKAWIRSSKK